MKSQDFARFPHWQSTFWQRVLLLTSGKHLPGITNAACSDPHHRPPFHCMWAPITVMWAPVPLHVGTDYAMWAAITVNLKMLPTSQRNRCPHHSVLGAHMPTESLPTSTGIRNRISLEQRHYASTTINLRLAAVRRLAYEAADCGLLSADLAAGIRRVKDAKRLGAPVGNWLTAEQGKHLLSTADIASLRGKRDYAT